MPEAEAPRLNHCSVCLVHLASAALRVKSQNQKLSAISFLSQCKYLKIIISLYWKYLAPVLWLHHLDFLQFHSRLPVLYCCLVSMTKWWQSSSLAVDAAKWQKSICVQNQVNKSLKRPINTSMYLTLSLEPGHACTTLSQGFVHWDWGDLLLF